MAMCNNRPGAPLVQNFLQDSLPSLAAPKCRSKTNHDDLRHHALVYRAMERAYWQVREPAPDDYDASEGDGAMDDEVPSAKEALSLKLPRLADNLNKVVAVHHFHYDAVEELVADLLQGDKPKTLQGLSLTSGWLRERDRAIVDALDDIRSWARESSDA